MVGKTTVSSMGTSSNVMTGFTFRSYLRLVGKGSATVRCPQASISV
jgi:hypothetical protein